MKIERKIYHGRQLTKVCYMVMQDVNHQLFTNSVLSEVLLSMGHPDEDKAVKILESLDLDEYKEKHPAPLRAGCLGDPYGNRTHVTAVKGPCLNRLTNGPDRIQDFAKTASNPPATIATGPQVF